MVFVGISKPPSSANWPNPPYTVIKKTSLIREKPFIVIDNGGNYSVFAPDKGTPALITADVGGIKIGGFIFEATATNSPTLVQIGDSGSAASHAADPISLHDIFCRAGASFKGLADRLLTINSSDVIGDHFWLWRADHGAGRINHVINGTGGAVNSGNGTARVK